MRLFRLLICSLLTSQNKIILSYAIAQITALVFIFSFSIHGLAFQLGDAT